MSVFYERFERHAHGEGLKGRSTHYCPGCGHGLVHKYLAEAIENLGIQDRTVAISPGGLQRVPLLLPRRGQHAGRARPGARGGPRPQAGQPRLHRRSAIRATAIWPPSAWPRSFHAAQLGIPMTVMFVNNAIYGMTGGQMAPTTLMGQKTATRPYGRDRFMGEPLRMAELMAQIDGPVYVERVALFDAQQRVKAQKAIHKALRLQVENQASPSSKCWRSARCTWG